VHYLTERFLIDESDAVLQENVWKVAELEKSWLEALQTEDVATLNELLHDGFTSTPPAFWAK
jgi:hypothetical protein